MRYGSVETAGPRSVHPDPVADPGSARLTTAPLVTPDGRYLVVRGRLWRRSDPRLAETRRQALVDELMHARRAVARTMRSDPAALSAARAAVDAAKTALGERGPVWWTDGAPDLTRRMARNTSYADWYAAAGANAT